MNPDSVCGRHWGGLGAPAYSPTSSPAALLLWSVGWRMALVNGALSPAAWLMVVSGLRQGAASKLLACLAVRRCYDGTRLRRLGLLPSSCSECANVCIVRGGGCAWVHAAEACLNFMPRMQLHALCVGEGEGAQRAPACGLVKILDGPPFNPGGKAAVSTAACRIYPHGGGGGGHQRRRAAMHTTQALGCWRVVASMPDGKLHSLQGVQRRAFFGVSQAAVVGRTGGQAHNCLAASWRQAGHNRPCRAAHNGTVAVFE